MGTDSLHPVWWLLPSGLEFEALVSTSMATGPEQACIERLLAFLGEPIGDHEQGSLSANHVLRGGIDIDIANRSLLHVFSISSLPGSRFPRF